MALTPRDYFRRRLRAILGAIAFAWLLIPVGALWWGHGANAAQPVAAVLFALVAILVIGAVIALYRTRCPACGGHVGDLGSQLVGKLSSKDIDACPHCGAHFDEPLPETRRSP